MANVACGNKVHKAVWPAQVHHYSAAQVRECFATPDGLWTVEDEHEQYMDYLAEDDPDAANERHLENAGWEEALLQDQMEAQMGVIPFDEAMRNAEAEARAEAFIPAGNSSVIPDGGEDTKWAAEDTSKPLLDGIYTVETPHGHRTLRLRTQSSKDDFMPGRQIVGYLNGSDNENDYVNFGTVEAGRLRVWSKHRDNHVLVRQTKALLEDPDSALVASHCYRCHALLTTPESILSGFGPVCIGKGV